jgi:hypothetical protein
VSKRTGPDYSCKCGCGEKAFFQSYLLYGPERPTDPGGIGPYTADRFEFRGHVLHKRNLWLRHHQEWACQYTALSAVGPGDLVAWADPLDWAACGWTARVTQIEGEGSTMLEALEDAWRLAESEGQLHNLRPPEVWA